MKIRTMSQDELILSDHVRPAGLVFAFLLTLACAGYAYIEPMWLHDLVAALAVAVTLVIALSASFVQEAVFNARTRVVTIRRTNRIVSGKVRRLPFAKVRGIAVREIRGRKPEDATYRYTLLTDDGPQTLSPLSHSHQPPDAIVAEIRGWLRAHDLPTGS